jgi:hypothetical protein
MIFSPLAESTLRVAIDVKSDYSPCASTTNAFEAPYAASFSPRRVSTLAPVTLNQGRAKEKKKKWLVRLYPTRNLKSNNNQ